MRQKPILAHALGVDPERSLHVTMAEQILHRLRVVFGTHKVGGKTRPAPRRRAQLLIGMLVKTQTSDIMISRPDLVRLDRATRESGADQKRLDLPAGLFTAIGWYARFPNHYSGEGAAATRELGEYEMTAWTDSIVRAIRVVKADQMSLELQNEFYEKSTHPLESLPK